MEGIKGWSWYIYLIHKESKLVTNNQKQRVIIAQTVGTNTTSNTSNAAITYIIHELIIYKYTLFYFLLTT